MTGEEILSLLNIENKLTLLYFSPDGALEPLSSMVASTLAQIASPQVLSKHTSGKMP